DSDRIENIETQLARTREERQQLETAMAQENAGLEAAQREHARLQGQLSSLESRRDNLERQRREAVAEVERLKARQAEDGAAVAKARGEMEAALKRMQASEAAREPLQRERRELDTARQQARQRLNDARSKREALSIKAESSRAGLES